MGVRSRDFVGIAEGIRSHELSAKSQIENLKGCISKLSARRSSLNRTISYLEAAIAAEYERRRPDREYIEELKEEKSSTKEALDDVESELDSTNHELNNKQNELQEVEEEKAQTLFEIQERARKTSNNISLVGGMYGAYAGVGSSIQDSLQTSLSSLGQAASILGGSVETASRGTGRSSSSGSGSISSGEMGNKNTEVGALTAFTGGNFSGTSPLSASRFSTTQDVSATPATLPNYHSGKGTINTKNVQNFITSQDKNGYAISSFGSDVDGQADFQNADVYCSKQTSQNMEVTFSSMEESSFLEEHSPHKHTFADWINPNNYVNGRYIGEGQEWGYKPYGKDASEFKNMMTHLSEEAKVSHMQMLGYGKNDCADFSGYGATRIQSNGNTWYIAGDNHVAYLEYYNHMNDYNIKNVVGKEHVVEYINPNMIEGISVSTREIEDSNLFWSQHKTDGTKESFMKIASYIPKVKELLDRGISFQEICNHPELGECASIYFDTNSLAAVRVLKGDGFYEFQSNGRHRILAARDFGISIPVIVVGEIVKKDGISEKMCDISNENTKGLSNSKIPPVKQKCVKVIKKLFRRENVKKILAAADIVVSLSGGVQAAKEMPNTYEDLIDNKVLEHKTNAYSDKNLFKLMNDMGYEVDNDKSVKDIIIEAGQIINGIGGDEDETALSDPFEKANEIKEEIESAILTKNSPTTSTEF